MYQNAHRIPPVRRLANGGRNYISGMLTYHQRRAMLFIEKEMARTGGIASTVREIANHFGYRSPTPARSLLAGREARGHIRRLPDLDRAIEVVKPVSRVAVYRFDERTKSLTFLVAKS